MQGVGLPNFMELPNLDTLKSKSYNGLYGTDG